MIYNSTRIHSTNKYAQHFFMLEGNMLKWENNNKVTFVISLTLYLSLCFPFTIYRDHKKEYHSNNNKNNKIGRELYCDFKP